MSGELMVLRSSILKMRPMVPMTICGRSISCCLSSWMLDPPMERWVVTKAEVAEADTRVCIFCAASRLELRIIA